MSKWNQSYVLLEPGYTDFHPFFNGSTSQSRSIENQDMLHQSRMGSFDVSDDGSYIAMKFFAKGIYFLFEIDIGTEDMIEK